MLIAVEQKVLKCSSGGTLDESSQCALSAYGLLRSSAGILPVVG